MPSRIDEAVHTKAFDYPVAEHWGESLGHWGGGCFVLGERFCWAMNVFPYNR